MEIKEFMEVIREELEKKTGLEVRSQEVRKNNNVILHGINIMDKDSNISPVIYMEPYHEAYENGVKLAEITERIYEVYQREKLDDTFDMGWFRDWEQVKGQVAYKLINYLDNVELLETIPHEKFLDLVKVYYVSVNSEKLGKGTILIHNSHLDVWGISAEQLRLVADENTPKLLPVEIGSMYEVMKSLLGYEMEEDFKEYPMYIATNSHKTFGAAVLCYTGAIKEFAEQLESDLFVLPSSTHEVIIVLPKEDGSADALKEMVCEVNSTMLRSEEILSDSVYFYSRDTDTLSIA
ncbi:MAG: hypothetical protein IJX86_13020 [Lachnospiraceae bacterium]|nr:hypothetical protein [Lachnospiraceae bacterium]